MPQLKAVIFDYGNVLSISPLESDISQMSKIFTVSDEQFEQAYWKYRLDYDCGLTSNFNYWQSVSKELDKSVNQNQINQLTELDVTSWSRPNEHVVKYAHELLEKGIELALLSNMPVDLKNWVETSCTWLPEFSHRTYSCELKCAKPEAEIYKHSLEGLSNHAVNTIFVDDREENTEAAIKNGVNSILFKDVSELKEKIDSMI